MKDFTSILCEESGEIASPNEVALQGLKQQHYSAGYAIGRREAMDELADMMREYGLTVTIEFGRIKAFRHCGGDMHDTFGTDPLEAVRACVAKIRGER